MEKYSSYKDSGFAWMGQIPSHWETRRFRFLLAENSTQNTELKERKQLQFKYGDIVPKADQSEDKDVLDTIKKYTVVAPGDIMINGLNLNYDFISQRVAQVQEPGVITSAYVSLRPLEGANSKYYTYYMKAMDAQKMFHGMGSGVRLTLSYDNLKNLFFPYPSPEEQEAIVAYLDAATAKIDEAIAQQQRMIDLLNERKRIILANAVAQGVSGVKSSKDSGISYWGYIPNNWSVIALKYLGSYSKKTLNPSEVPNTDLLEYSMPAFDNGRVPNMVNSKDLDSAKTRLDESTLLINKLNVHKERIWFVENPGENSVASTEFIPIRIHSANPKFIEYALQNHRITSYLIANSNGATNSQKRVSPDTVLGLKLAIPPIEEQNRIVKYLGGVYEPFKKAVDACQSVVASLQERKQIIINDVVTGKVKV